MLMGKKIDDSKLPPILIRYSSYCRSIQLTETTVNGYLYRLLPLNEFMEKTRLKPLEELERVDVELYMREVGLRRESEEIKQSYVKSTAMIVKVFAEWLVDEEIMDAKQFFRIGRFIDKIPNGAVGEDNREALNKEEEKKLFSQLLDVLFQIILWTGFNFGLRRKEYCNLRIEHLELDREEPRLKIELSKGRVKKTRYIYLFPGQVSQWRTWLNYRKSLNLPHDFVFYNPKNPSLRLTSNTIGYFFTKIAKITQVKLYSHRLRYTYAVRLWEAGVDIFVISKLLGHSKAETTIKYLRVPERDLVLKFKESAKAIFH